jgi:hypothetical protein
MQRHVSPSNIANNRSTIGFGVMPLAAAHGASEGAIKVDAA